MPERELTTMETIRLLNENEKELFRAIEVVENEKKLSLHDLCIIELNAKISALTEIVIRQGRQLNSLQHGGERSE